VTFSGNFTTKVSHHPVSEFWGELYVLPSGGDPLLVTYIWSWEMHQIPINPLELFNANIFAPFKNTLAFTEHMLGSLLLAWPLFLIFKNIGWILTSNATVLIN